MKKILRMIQRPVCLRLVLVATTVLVAALFSEAQTRRAIVIGLGEQLDRSWGEIHGDRDVPLVASMLKSAGFTDIRTLVNSQATKAAIVSSINSLISRSSKGDVVYIHFSGHGQRMTDLDGDEDDGWDEAWIPYDAFRKYCDRDRGDKHLSDDELSRYLTRLRGKVGASGTIAVVVDACHSGDSTRDGEGWDSVVVRGVYDHFVIPGKRAARRNAVMESWLTLSACKDYQLNEEYNKCGKLTHIIVNNWRDYAGQSDQTIFSKIDKTMQSRMYKGRLGQNPDLTGAIGKVLSIIFQKK